jgi:hypothetical protein
LRAHQKFLVARLRRFQVARLRRDATKTSQNSRISSCGAMYCDGSANGIIAAQNKFLPGESNSKEILLFNLDVTGDCTNYALKLFREPSPADR